MNGNDTPARRDERAVARRNANIPNKNPSAANMAFIAIRKNIPPKSKLKIIPGKRIDHLATPKKISAT